jgi:hypothetical protein
MLELINLTHRGRDILPYTEESLAARASPARLLLGGLANYRSSQGLIAAAGAGLIARYG